MRLLERCVHIGRQYLDRLEPGIVRTRSERLVYLFNNDRVESRLGG